MLTVQIQGRCAGAGPGFGCLYTRTRTPLYRVHRMEDSWISSKGLDLQLTLQRAPFAPQNPKEHTGQVLFLLAGQVILSIQNTQAVQEAIPGSKHNHTLFFPTNFILLN